MAKDFFKNEIEIGATVAFMRLRSRSLAVGQVISITEQTVLITDKGAPTRQRHNQVIVKK